MGITRRDFIKQFGLATLGVAALQNIPEILDLVETKPEIPTVGKAWIENGGVNWVGLNNAIHREAGRILGEALARKRDQDLLALFNESV